MKDCIYKLVIGCCLLKDCKCGRPTPQNPNQ